MPQVPLCKFMRYDSPWRLERDATVVGVIPFALVAYLFLFSVHAACDMDRTSLVWHLDRLYGRWIERKVRR